MVTLDWLHLILIGLFWIVVLWHVISTAGAQMIISHLRREKAILVAALTRDQEGSNNERTDQPVS